METAIVAAVQAAPEFLDVFHLSVDTTPRQPVTFLPASPVDPA